jgi:hypothetical protein
MIRAVRHFLWYLEHQSAGGRYPHRPPRAAHVVKVSGVFSKESGAPPSGRKQATDKPDPS